MPTCAVQGCGGTRATLHRVPLRNSQRKNQWLAAINNPNYDENTPCETLRNIRVCSRHFKPQDFKQDLKSELLGTKPRTELQEDAVPSIFPWTISTGIQYTETSQKRSRVKVPPEKAASPSLSLCSELEEKSWPKAVKSLQTQQGSSIFRASDVLVNTQCLLELFQLCWLCHRECCITIEGNERLFSVTQDCQSCGYHKQWKSHPTSANDAELYPEAEPTVKYDDDEKVLVKITSSEKEGIGPSYEQTFSETDVSSGEEETDLPEEESETKRKRKSENQDRCDEWKPHVNEKDTDSDVSMDENLFTVLKEDHQLKVVVWCVDCKTDASLSCSLRRHQKVFCCARCCDEAEVHDFEKFSVRFDDFLSFQRHAEVEHGAKQIYKLCQECGKFTIADPESGGTKDHKCEHKAKQIVCTECGKRRFTDIDLKRHYAKHHKGSIQTKPSKLKHEHLKQKHPYSCSDCSSRFYKQNDHLKLHRGPYKYVWDSCEKGFNDFNRLKKHKLIHSGEKPFECQVCLCSSNQMENLNSRMCLHTGEKPFMCTECGKCLSQNVSLKNQQLQHQNARGDSEEARDMPK